MAIFAPGTVVQTEFGMTSRVQAYTSDTYVIGTECYLVPKYANSKFIIEATCPTNTSDDSDAANGNSNPYWGMTIQRNINGAGWTNADNLGTDSTGNTNVHFECSPWRAGGNGDGYSYNQGRRYRMKPAGTIIIDTPSYSLGNYIIYRLYLDRNGGWGQVGAPEGSGGDDNYLNYHYGICVQEVVT